MDLIEDPIEARRRIERFLERARRRDAYGELLASGQVSRLLDDPDARKNLRSDLRRQARADKLKIITREYGEVVVAMLDRPTTPERDEEALNAIRSAYQAADVAELLGHLPRVAAREHSEAVALCTTCRALGHANGTGDELELAGALYTDRCRS